MHFNEQDKKSSIDPQTVRNLEFDKVLNIVSSYARWGAAADIIKELHPLKDPEDLRDRQEELAEAMGLRQDKDFFLDCEGFGDVQSYIKSAARSKTLEPQQLKAVFELARTSRTVGTFLRDHSGDFPRLADKALRLGVFRDLEKLLSRAVTADGELSPNATPALARIRQEMAEAKSEVERRLYAFLHNPEYSRMIQDPIITTRFERQVIPIKVEYRTHFPGIIIDQSASGATLFMEPLSVMEMSNLSRAKALAEAAEVQRILQTLTEKIGEQSRVLLDSCEELAWLETLISVCKYSEHVQAFIPEITDGGYLCLNSSRHPLLVERLGNRVVPMTFDLSEGIRTLVITGPNTGGKTVALKTIGLIVMMALSGLPVPVESGTRIPFFDQVWADIGDDQNIMQNLSTFSAHIHHILRILPNVGSRTLILLDELGAGTDPAEGGALAEALLEHFQNKGACCALTTHLAELKNFASQHEGMSNAAAEFDGDTLAPTYKIIMGIPGRSNALKIARRLGLPADLERRATELLGGSSAQVEGLLSELDKEREVNERLAKKLRDQLSQLGRLRSSYEDKIGAAQQECAQMLSRASAESRKLAEETRKRVQGLTGSVRRSLSQLSRVRSQSIVELRQAASELAQALIQFEALEELVELNPVASAALSKALREAVEFKRSREGGVSVRTSAPAVQKETVSSLSEEEAMQLGVAEEDIGDYRDYLESEDKGPDKAASSRLDKLDMYVRSQARDAELCLDSLLAGAAKADAAASKIPASGRRLRERFKNTASEALEISREADPAAAVSQSRSIQAKLAEELNLEGFEDKGDEDDKKAAADIPEKAVSLPLEVGSHVFVPRYGQDGTVLALSETKAEVQIGVIRIKVKRGDVQVIEPEESEIAPLPKGNMTFLKSRVDLHGMNVDEALWVLGDKIDKAFISGVHTLEIIHGKGTGTLRRAVLDYVKDHPSIASYRMGTAPEGGIGATIVELNN